jgi:hypothetical protein
VTTVLDKLDGGTVYIHEQALTTLVASPSQLAAKRGMLFPGV